jgi:hypothetical protein
MVKYIDSTNVVDMFILSEQYAAPELKQVRRIVSFCFLWESYLSLLTVRSIAFP